MYGEAYRRGATNLQSVYAARDKVLLAENRLLSERYNLAAAIPEPEKEAPLPFGSLVYQERKRTAPPHESP
jgi:hypothetical protein